MIGGADIYAQTLPLAQRMELTEIHAEVAGDAYFPAFSCLDWSELKRESHVSPDGLAYDFVSYQRKD